MRTDSDEAIPQNTLPSIKEQTASEPEDKPLETAQDAKETAQDEKETAEHEPVATQSDEDLLSSEEFVLLNLDTQQEIHEQSQASQLSDEKVTSGEEHGLSQQNLEPSSFQAEELSENSSSQLNDSGASADVSKETPGEEKAEEDKASETEDEGKTAVNTSAVTVNGDSESRFLLVPIEKVCCVHTYLICLFVCVTGVQCVARSCG